MREYTDWECINAFINQCNVDKSHIEHILKLFKCHIIHIGRRILNDEVRWSFSAYPGKDEELLDYMDGNGFHIHKCGSSNIYRIVLVREYPWSE